MSPASPVSDARANATTAALVGAIVLVLGFGSGIGAVFSHHTAFSSSSPASSAAHTAAVGQAGSPSVGAAALPDDAVLLGSGAPAGTAARSASVSAASTRQASIAGTSTSATPASSKGTASSASSSGTAAGSSSSPSGTCSGQMVADAMFSPFVTHFDHAHLEESPSQQAGDLTNPDGYVKTHTVLFEQMLAPGIALGLVSTQGIEPFVMHFDNAHLAESPAQQAADLLNLNQYVKTHTVLVEDMTAPATDAATGTGC